MVWWNPWGKLNANSAALKENLQTYVKAYTNIRNKNNKSALPPLNAKIINALKRYINSKRPKVAGAVAAAVNNAGGSNKNAVAAAAGVATSNTSTPNAAANAAVKPLLAIGAPPVQVAAAAAGAAKQKALALGMGSNAANNAAANAAASAANTARPNATPAQAAQTAAAGAAAAGLPPNNQAQAAAEAANEAEGVSAANRSNAQAAMNKINGILRRPLPESLSRATANALRRQLNTSVAIARAEGLVTANKNKELNNYRARINAKLAQATRAEGLMAQTQRSETARPTVIPVNFSETKRIKVPNTNIEVNVERNNKNSKWRFVREENSKKYNLLNRNQETPKIRNISNVRTGNLFRQGN